MRSELGAVPPPVSPVLIDLKVRTAGPAMETDMNLAIDAVGGRGVLAKPRRRG